MTERLSRASKLFGNRSAGTPEERGREGLRYYLLVYDTQAQRLSEEPTTLFDGEAAHAAFVEAEERLRSHSDMQVVMFVARSLESVRSTRQHYFDEAAEPGGDTVDFLIPRP